MANIIDAMLVTLGLDTKDFDKGKDAVKHGLKDTADEAKKRGGEVEASAKKQAEAYAKLRGEVTGFLLTLAGAKTLTQFGANLIQSTANVGRLSQVFGVSATEIIGWQGVIKGAGGSAEDATAAIAKLKDMQANFYLHPESVPMAQLGQLGFGGSPNTVANQLGNPSEVFLHLADQYQKELGRARSTGNPNAESTLQATFGKRLQETFGLTPAWIAAIERGRPALEEQLNIEERRANLTKDNMEAARELNETITHLQMSLLGVARATGVIEALDGVASILDVLTGSSNALSDHAKAVAAGFAVMLDPMASLILLMQKVGLISQDTARKVLEYDPIASRLGHWLNEPNAQTQGALGNPGATVPQAYGGQSSGNYGQAVEQRLAARGVRGDLAQGIGAGVTAEGGGLGYSKNGAFGIGQWRGSRLRALFARYGGAPTLDQQVQFLHGELNGGDPGGRSVMAQGNARGAMAAYILNFMRPGSGTAGDLRRGMTALNRGPAGNTATVAVHVDARGNPNPHAVGQAAERGVKKAMSGTHRVANANGGMMG